MLAELAKPMKIINLCGICKHSKNHFLKLQLVKQEVFNLTDIKFIFA
jgi:hypothetical protein